MAVDKRGKTRDYRAEYERKEAAARAAGYPSYWAMRLAKYGRSKAKPRRPTS